MESESVVFDCLEDYHRRHALGEHITPAEYEERLGKDYQEFLAALEVEAVLERLLEPPDEKALPRPFGEYTLLRELGRGAVGLVYEAVHRKLGRRVALKILRAGLGDDPGARERFLRECSACAQARHPNIVQMHEAGSVEGQIYYSMELVEGQSLDRWLAEHPDTSAEDLCRGIAQVADALRSLHEVDIIHRDVKPSNILVAKDGRMVLADFGLARTAMAETLTHTGVALGTPLYMSPEQILGQRHEIDGRADLYGLGATLYQTLTGRPPFRSEEVHGLIRMILQERPVPPEDLVPGLSPDCGRIVLKCLEKRREDRYATAADLRDDLVRFADGEQVVGRPVSRGRRVARSVRHHRRWVAAAVVLVLAPLLYVLLRPSPPPEPAYFSALVWPDGYVHIQGQERFAAPVQNVKIAAPGRYVVTYESDGFISQSETLEAHPGETIPRAVTLKVADPTDPAVINRVFAAAGVAPPEYAPVAVHRGGWSAQAYPLWPRGRCRAGDVRTLVLRCSVDYEGPWALELRDGEDVLYSVAEYEPEYALTREGLPEEVTARLRPGRTYTWGLVPEEGNAAQPIRADFEIVADPTEEASARMAAVFGAEQVPAESQPRGLLLLRARLFLQAGLYQAAYEEAGRAAQTGDADRLRLEALLVQRTALSAAAGAGEEVQLQGTPEFVDLQQQLREDRWPAEDWAALLPK